MIRTTLAALLLSGSLCFAADVTGDYSGSYTSNGGEYSGTVHLSLSKGADSTWTCKFTHSDGITAKVVSCSGAGDKVVMDFETEVQGADLKVHLEGSKGADGALTGTYKSTPTGGGESDTGTWKASAQQ